MRRVRSMAMATTTVGDGEKKGMSVITTTE